LKDPKNAIFKDFGELPLSDPTRSGLKGAHYTSMTDIQAKAIPLALKGADILGAAKTGSGKTLAFVIPVLENLYRMQFVGKEAGLGAMIISPTRELAIQIFEVLHKIGKRGHTFAAGLIIGGKSLHEEQDALVRMNIVVCTPGRMLQHLSQTASFNTDGLQILVLDEADRILDMGFQREVDAILDYLPKERQTMLFSATQTKRVSDLARLSLKDPEYISVHQEASTATPKGLQQNYVVTPLPEKLDTLWSFIQSAKKSKIIVFFSSAKQVRYVYESFRHMQPGIPLLHLHGRQKQSTRLEITKKFATARQSCLFATDVAARGLDFPAIDWVVQVDCPEDADTYIHRVGRTARYESEGRAILFLDPSEEEGMLKRLEAKKVPIEKVNVKNNKKKSIINALQNMCFKDTQLKYLGQKAFTSYVRSIYVQKDKDIFHMDKLPLEEFAASLGLPGAPRIKFLAGDDPKARKNAPRVLPSDSEEDEESELEETRQKAKASAGVRTKYDRMFERKNQDILADHYGKLVKFDDEESEASVESEDENAERMEVDDFLTVKRHIPISGRDSSGLVLPDQPDHKKVVHVAGIKEPLLIDSNRAEKRLHSKKQLLKYKEKGQRLVFDDDGQAHPIYELEDEAQFRKHGAPEEQRQRFIEEEKSKVSIQDLNDKLATKTRRKEKKDRRKEFERGEAAKAQGVAGDGDESEDDAHEGPNHDLVQDFLDDTKELYSDESGDEERQPKREKKWFELDGKVQKSKKGREDLEAFEDLENLAANLLDG
jgi:ATP-dependent RNA helicase DDX10/DBP4